MLTTDHLRSYPLLKDLRSDELERLLPHINKRSFARGVYLFYPQSPSTNTYLVESGLVRLFFINAEGQEFMLKLVRPREVFGLPVVEEDSTRILGAATLQNSVILAITCEQLLNAMQTTPQLALNLYREASFSARLLLMHTRNLVTLSVNARLAAFLLNLTQIQKSVHTIILPINQAELAGWLGSSRGRLNRALSLLQKQELIHIDNANIEILNLPELERLAKTGA